MQRTVSAFFIGEKWVLKTFDSDFLNTELKKSLHS